MKNFIGIDNGVSGSVGIISDGVPSYYHTPVIRQLSYTKSKKFINRIDFEALKRLLFMYREDSFCLIERPFTGKFYTTVVSGARALESTLICIEGFGIPYSYIDSKEWQKALLPSGIEKQELKFAGLNVAERLFPSLDLSDFNDADGVLIAEHCRRLKK